MRRLGSGGALAATLFVAAACSQAPASGTGGPYQATIHRDAWGAPHVMAATDEAAAFGMAYALAEDDWPLIEANYLSALGRSAEVDGDVALADDWMARALEIVPLSIAEYERATPRMRGLLDAFAAGLDRFLADHPDRVRRLDRVEPWYPLALIRYKYYQNEFIWYAGLERGWWLRAMEASAADAQTARSVGAAERPVRLTSNAGADLFGVRPFGSNQFALAPTRTRDGHAMLLINPHQSFVGVQRYAEIHLQSDEGLHFSGLTVFGFLLPYMGHNERLGWAYTDNYADRGDFYALSFDDPARPDAYRYDGGWREARRWSDSIVVRNEGGTTTRRFEFRASHHGPVIALDDEGRPLAIRMAGMEEGGWFDQWDAMIRARTLDEWREAAGALRVAYMNTMYADADGTIGYVYNSAVPRRDPAFDYGGVVDGSDPAVEWNGIHDFDELPQVWNPESGWLLNTNSTPFTATVDAGMGAPGDYPAYMLGPETDNPRAVSSRALLEGLDGVDFDGFARAVWHSRLSLADGWIPALDDEWQRGASGGFAGRRAALEAAVRRLSGWDRVVDTTSIEATWFTLAVERQQMAGGSGEGGLSHLAALDEALRLLEERWGEVEVPWGRLARHQRPLPGAPRALDEGRPSLAVGGAHGMLGSPFVFGTQPMGEAGPRLGVHGNSFVKVVEFGPTVRAASVLNYGQSGDPASPHFFDQAALYAARSFKPAWFGADEVRENAVRSYTVGG